MDDKKHILDTIDNPGGLKDLNEAQLKELCAEIRERLIATTAHTGGHLAPNLGVVELTVGLYRALDCPPDMVVFDVGHQAYVHKLLTGRRDAFDTLRTYGGISGFPKRSESPYDLYGSGHASDSLSIALGYALARDARGGDETVVAVIGDGSMTGGMAWEALNQIGQCQTRLIIILNDNEMSISRNESAFEASLGWARMNPRYWETREKIQRKLSRPGVGRGLVRLGTRVKDSFKHLVVPGVVFEELGLVSVGPVDGHDIGLVEAAVKAAREMDGPVLIHTVTRKGKGYEPAQSDPALFHGIGAFDPDTGELLKKNVNGAPTYTEVFAKALIAEAAENPDIVAITAAMPAGTGLDKFQKAYPDRFIDVGIAEGHAVGLAAGLAFGGRLPVVAVYSTFLQRAYDQLIGDVALQGAHVVFALDRAGFVGDDGPTHAGLYDLTYLRTIPTMRILAPSNEADLVCALHTALRLDGPVAVRYPRGTGTGAELPAQPCSWEVGQALCRHQGDRGAPVAILAVGHMLERAEACRELLAGRGIDASLWDMRWVKPIDEEAVCSEAAAGKLLVTIEENTIRGGFGAAVAECLSAASLTAPLLQLAVPDEFSVQGPIDTLLDEAGLSPERMAERIAERLALLQGADDKTTPGVLLSRDDTVGEPHGAQEAR
ncbi:MAG: 1-deoxy-D-xylulose-5-phosphate synthase [Coriobacteriia bacterium]|nr:1-deoxy-D-xylulose-5-phosphate synthase [Coriobacteriia bacterium]